MSYIERGFTQKAYSACEKAYELGCRDTDFILMYALECDEYGQYDCGIQLLLEIIRQERKWSKEEMPELLEAYMGALKMNYSASDIYLSEILERLSITLEQYSRYFAEYIPELSFLLSRTGIYNGSGVEEYRMAERIFDIMYKAGHSDFEKEAVDDARIELDFKRLTEDDRIGDTLERAYDLCFDYFKLEPTLKTFAETDTLLCMIEEREEILEQTEIIRQEYPRFYEKISAYIEKLQKEKELIYFKDSLQKTYRRLEPYCSGGFYYEKYPQEREKAKGKIISDGMSFETYMRVSKKIGRNESCLCGSGKKYKQCCMNKGR